MQPLIYKERIQRWGFKQSMFVSLIFHGVVIFGISFVVIQQPWEFNEEVIVNIRFANGEFDMRGNSNNGHDSLQKNNQQVAMVSKDSSSQDQSQFSVRRLESNSTLESYETIYLNAWQRKVETIGFYETEKLKLDSDVKITLKAVIDKDGEILEISILKSSGLREVDELAKMILTQAAPFAAFDEEMRLQYDSLEIVRDWNFYK